MRNVFAVFVIGMVVIAAGVPIENLQRACADQTKTDSPENRGFELPLDDVVALEPEGVDPGGSAPWRRAALRFVASLVKGEVAVAVNRSSTPFVLANEQLKNAEDLASALDVLAKTPAVVTLRELHRTKRLKITKLEILEEPRLSLVVGRSFKPLALNDHILVLVRAEGIVGDEKGVFDYVLAMKPPSTPGGDPRVVGFGED